MGWRHCFFGVVVWVLVVELVPFGALCLYCLVERLIGMKLIIADFDEEDEDECEREEILMCCCLIEAARC